MRAETCPDLPDITNENFEERLSSDSVLVEFLNAFLQLPSFLEPIWYNRNKGVFEVGRDKAKSLSAQFTALLCEVKEKSTDPTWFPSEPLVDNSYMVSCLDRAQAMQWIRRERLPFFLQSDFYFEYRLVSCLCQLASQKENLLSEETLFSPSASTLQQEQPMLPLSSSSEDSSCHPAIGSKLTEATRGKTKPMQAQIDHSVMEVEANLTAQLCGGHIPSPSDCENHTLVHSTTMVHTSFTGISKEMEDKSDKELDWDLVQCHHQTSNNCEVSPVLNQNGQAKLHTAACPHCVKARNSLVYTNGSPASMQSLPEELSMSHIVQDSHSKPKFQASASSKPSTPAVPECATGTSVTTGGHGSRQVFSDFKRFLRGRPGERVLNLWMDIERLKTLHNLEARNRHLVWMKSQYLLGSSSTALSVEFLSRLELASPHCWTENKLCLVQSCLIEVLLLYWGQRFFTSCLNTKRRGTAFSWLCWDCQLSLPGVDYCLRHPTPQPQHPYCYLPSETPSSAPITVDGSYYSEMERMVQALHVESEAGFFFTHFCQNSGNQLWANAAQFCRDLQEYRHLFYQPTLDPYRVQHKAQLLYATYVCSAGCRSVGVGEQCRQHIFNCISPPFDELFDQAEEHTLSILQEPWTMLTHQDTNTFHKVAVWEEERIVEPELYETLQSLYTEMQCRQQQGAQDRRPPPPPTNTSKKPDIWAQVPPPFRHQRLGALLRNRLELQHFLSFLEENFASVDLLCWLDIEQLKRTPKDTAVWEEKSKNLRTQYLNRKYLFGPSSPANKQQQAEVLRLAGGWARLQCEPLSMSVLSEVQSLVRSRIEGKWLPLFFSSEEFIARQKLRAELGDVVEDQLFLRYRKKRQMWKQVDGGLMSVSQEVLALRRAMLNPVTRLHFRLFLSIRGELLENDLLFWLEVQRYKDLCHSHCDEATVQQKVSTIISCFIDSCIPPSVQIHLPPEQAELILQRRSTLGPYIFREAQMCVFSELLKHWPAFVEFRSSVCEEQLVSELEKKQSRERERQRREEKDQLYDRTSALLQGDRGSVIEGLIEEASMYGGGEEGDEDMDESENPVGLQLSWSYSKYMAALEREEILIKTRVLEEERADLCSAHSHRSGAHRTGRNTPQPARTHTPRSVTASVTGH